jgi:hypothetical protein
MVGSDTLNEIDIKIRLKRNNTNVFGGLSVIIMGDFMQIPPVKDTLIIDDLILLESEINMSNINKDRKLRDSQISGVQLFKKFLLFQFKEQMRSIDKEHSEFLENLRTFSYTENKLKLSEIIHKKFNVLSSSDIQNDINWISAPIVVTSNYERATINIQQAMIFGKLHNVPIFYWMPNLRGNVYTKLINKSHYEVLKKLLYDHEEVWEVSNVILKVNSKI